MDLLVAGIYVLALILAGLISTAMIWSVIYPDRRVWPRRFYGPQTPVNVWGVTCALFGAIVALGILGWGEAPTADPLRYVLGPLLILLGSPGAADCTICRKALARTAIRPSIQGLQGDGASLFVMWVKVINWSRLMKPDRLTIDINNDAPLTALTIRRL